MSERASDFEVVTWAVDRVDSPWRYARRDGWTDTSTHPFTIYQDRHEAALVEMRRQYEEAHEPSLAEKCARAFFGSWNAPAVSDVNWQSRPAKKAVAAIQAVLDREGVVILPPQKFPDDGTLPRND